MWRRSQPGPPAPPAWCWMPWTVRAIHGEDTRMTPWAPQCNLRSGHWPTSGRKDRLVVGATKGEQSTPAQGARGLVGPVAARSADGAPREVETMDLAADLVTSCITSASTRWHGPGGRLMGWQMSVIPTEASPRSHKMATDSFIVCAVASIMCFYTYSLTSD